MIAETPISPIRFSKEQWDAHMIKHRAWWDHELGRPLIYLTLTGAETTVPEPDIPSHGFAAFYGLETPVEAIVERWEYHLSKQIYIADGYPRVFVNFGPGVLAAMVGGTLECGQNTVWFHPKEDREVADLTFEDDPDSPWQARIASLMQAAVDRFQGQVQVSMTDLGGNLDIVSTFRPSEKLLLDLYDDPEGVEASLWRAHDAWWRHYERFNQVLQPVNPGYCAWAGIFSETPSYMLQCDFCYMIGPDMFDRFVKPELARSCEKLGHAFYHLDGPGQLPHLESLLSIEALDGVQWIPGSGSKPASEWPEVYRAISDAGKKIQLFGDLDLLETVADQIGRADNIVLVGGAPIAERAKIEKRLEKWIR